MLKRPAAPRARISLVPMIDVLLILLVFFMVTSTYLNLDMVPAGQPETTSAPPQDGAPSHTVMLRLSSNGQTILRGQTIDHDSLTGFLRAAVKTDQKTTVVILPSGTSTTQSLVALMDIVTRSGVASLRILRIEALK